jgi:hypothetical protein
VADLYGYKVQVTITSSGTAFVSGNVQLPKPIILAAKSWWATFGKNRGGMQLEEFLKHVFSESDMYDMEKDI